MNEQHTRTNLTGYFVEKKGVQILVIKLSDKEIKINNKSGKSKSIHMY